MARAAGNDPEGGIDVAETVREALARRRISRQRLADEARISLSTLEKALAGRRSFTLATLVRLEEVLGVRLRAPARPVAAAGVEQGQAPDDLGAYSKLAVAWLIGEWLTLRPSFGDPDAVYAYRTVIAWDKAASGLVFHEAGRLDAAFTQTGRVSLSNQSGHIYLVTNDHGQFRVATLGRPTITGELFGLLSTLQSGRGGQLTPVATPIALIPLRDGAQADVGRIGPDNPSHGPYRAWLDRIVGEGYAKLVSA